VSSPSGIERGLFPPKEINLSSDEGKLPLQAVLETHVRCFKWDEMDIPTAGIAHLSSITA